MKSSSKRLASALPALPCRLMLLKPPKPGPFRTLQSTGLCNTSSSVGDTTDGTHASPDTEKARHEEYQYLDATRHIITHGAERGNRTGTKTRSVFGMQARYSLQDGVLPLLTTKKMFWKGIVEELLWFISGSTNAKELADKDVHIWDANGSRKYLDEHGFPNRNEGDLGPIYGFQWRHFGAEYKDCKTDYTGQGVDQLAEVIHKIETNPEDRRIIMSAWNPQDIPKMALPPCHAFVQFYVANSKLSCQMYQRSADMGLGVPFNIASYSLLTHMIAHITGLEPEHFVHSTGDTHVYLNHIEALQKQLKRNPRTFPRIAIKRRVKTIEDFRFEDFELVGYKPHGQVKLPMNV